jgi:DNA polymerase III subunit gamma/tau
MPWDLKYRPRTFDEVVGHDVTVKILRTRVRTKTALDQSYVFSGPHGSGKTTLARILASAALCSSPQDGNPCLKCSSCRSIVEGRSLDYEERDAASQGTVDDVREVIRDLDFVSTKAKVICWDEAHRMSNASQDALLKPVEEHRLICVFATTEPGKIRGAIRSRCDDFSINRVPVEAVAARLQNICEREEVEHDPAALHLIARFAGGHVRDAIKRAEMVSRLGPISVDAVKEVLRLDVQSVAYAALLSVSEGDAPQLIEFLQSMMNRVSPAEAVNNLARAALQAYRRGYGYGDSVDPLDEELADRLFARLGASLPQVASFLADRPGRLSQEAVECRLLSLLERMRMSVPLSSSVVVLGVAAEKTDPAAKDEADLDSRSADRSVSRSAPADSKLDGMFPGRHPGRGPLVDTDAKVEPVLSAPVRKPGESSSTEDFKALLSQTLGG